MSGKIDPTKEPSFPAPKDLQTKSNIDPQLPKHSVQFFSTKSNNDSLAEAKNGRKKKAPKSQLSHVQLKSNLTQGVKKIEPAFTDVTLAQNKKLFGRGTPFKTPNLRARESLTHKTPLAGRETREVKQGKDCLVDSFTPDQGLSSMLKQHQGYSFKKDAENKIPIVEDQTPNSPQRNDLLSRSLFKNEEGAGSIFQNEEKTSGLFKNDDKKLSIFHSDFQGNHQVASSLKGIGGRRMGDSGFFRNSSIFLGF